MAVDYLLSADGSAPIEVQLSFLKSRMKMAPREIAEALRLTGLDGGEATAKPGTSATVVREAEQAQQAASEPAAAATSAHWLSLFGLTSLPKPPVISFRGLPWGRKGRTVCWSPFHKPLLEARLQ